MRFSEGTEILSSIAHSSIKITGKGEMRLYVGY